MIPVGASTADTRAMTTTVCDAVRSAAVSAATLSSTSEGALDLFQAAGWLSTAVTEALEAATPPAPVPLG